jgi:uncharacterized protein
MPRRIFRRLMPNPQLIREHRSLRLVSSLLHDPNLWHLNRHSVSVAAFVGIFVGAQPLPIHMLMAATASVVLRCNVTLALLLVWLSNPLTMPVIFYFEYRLGAWLLRLPADTGSFEMSLAWLEHSLHEIWEPLFLGSVLSGLIGGALAWALTRLAWRVGVVLKWRARRRARSRREPR